MTIHHINMKRDPSGEDHTFGTLVFGEFFCDTMEDEYREVKVAGETRIPEGDYEIQLRTEGKMHQRYLDRFEWHQGMLWLQDVPEFDWIYIHPLNFEHQTEGCIGPGYGRGYDNGKPMVKNSVAAYKDLYQLVVPLLKPMNSTIIHIR